MKKTLLALSLALSTLFAINFNTASKKELMQIKGIGPKKAEAIIKYRQTHKINGIEDLKNIKGFNTKTIEKIKNQEKKLEKKKEKIKNKKEKVKSKFLAKKEKMNKRTQKIKAKKAKFKEQKQQKLKKLNEKKDSLKKLKKGIKF